MRVNMNIIRKIRARIKLFKDRRFLAKHNCPTWIAYYRKNDPRINRYANTIADFYFGYKYLAIFESSKPFISEGNGSWWDGYQKMAKWCDENCKGHYREDINRVFRSHSGDWVINEIGGGDVLFVAFDNEQDYTWFTLRWT